MKEIYEVNPEDKKVYNIIPEFFRKTLGLDGSEPYILVQKDEEDAFDNSDSYLDIHAGGFETSCMLLDFKELVNEELARELDSSKITFELLRK